MKKEYKQLYDNINPADELIDKLFEAQNKNNSSNIKKQILVTVMCLAILAVTGGLGINAHINATAVTTQSTTPKKHEYTQGMGGILVAYAKNGNENLVSKLDISGQPSFFKLTIIDVSDLTEDEINSKMEEIRENNRDFADSNTNDDGVYFRREYMPAENTDEKSYIFSRIAGGCFKLDINDMSKVKNVTISNKSDYGTVTLNYDSGEDIANDFIHCNKESNHTIKITGDALQKSVYAGMIEDGHRITWEVGNDFYKELFKNPNYDLTKLKDEIKFTINFDDGRVAESIINISFDKDGNMIISDGGYKLD
ncbi:MAG: hypothetical protein NC213_10420 [Acetobacter sp.]|nr:hypothetical protein [Bacteroides sp.]MCM1342149.1 hypothetical protein [Acetobacter sp.]MCM1434377.1 hypothetical protein [Clostridiales bacterium]